METRDLEINTDEQVNDNQLPENTIENTESIENVDENHFPKEENPDLFPELDDIDVDWKQQEQIIEQMYNSGTILVKTRDLLINGIEPSVIKTLDFNIGKFRIYRLLLTAPYKIEKIN